MRYRIEIANKPYQYANNRQELLKALKHSQGEIEDIRKVMKSGRTDSVLEQYASYISK
jgi:predicted transcriptional regulator